MRPSTSGSTGRLGGIAPGRWADFLVLPEVRTVRPEIVVAQGRSSPATGAASCACPDVPMPAGLLLVASARGRSIRPRSASRRPARDARVRVIRIAGDIVTAEAEATLPVQDGAVLADPASDLLLAAVCDAPGSGMRRGLGVVQGFGLREGAVASTLSFDTSDLVVVGASREALAAAGRARWTIGGGFVVVDGRGSRARGAAAPTRRRPQRRSPCRTRRAGSGR